MAFFLFLLLTGGIDFSGQASANLGAGGYQRQRVGQVGVAYRPELELDRAGRNRGFNFVASLLADAGISLRGDSVKSELRLAPYRLLLGYGGERYELRAGLQQINFGAAVILRPLRWFDRIDPRDPLQITEGVYGLLGRYYPGNHSVWLWGLLGNKNPKGMELTPTPQWQPEAGARVELALPAGELGGSCHTRETVLPADTVREFRLGVDGRWDIGIGLWFEAMLSRIPGGGQGQAMLGADYTFAVGNGLTILTEQMTVHCDNQGRYFSALSLSYPLNISDNLNLLSLVDWQGRKPYVYLGWQKKTDRWLFTAAGFWGDASGIDSGGGMMDRGLVLQLAFNH